MSTITLDEATVEKLRAFNTRVELRDPKAMLSDSFGPRRASMRRVKCPT